MLKALRREPGFYRHLFALALPMILQNLITTSLSFADTVRVGLLGNAEMAAVTAAISALPSRPTMNVSAKLRDVVIRFCSTIGSASRNRR